MSRTLRAGFPLPGVAALILALCAPVPVRADVILSGPAGSEAGAEGAAVPDSSGPEGGGGGEDGVHVGYALTWDEFFGGAIMLGVAVGGLAWLSVLAATDKI